MLQFAQSIWLWAVAGIIVPVIIHLWNVKEGKTLKVGSIAFLAESAKSHAKSFKLSELLLLLLRCLLLIVLALLIAGPYFTKQSDNRNEKGWLLINKNDVHEVYKKFQPTIDALIKAGYTFHYFNSGFKEDQLAEVVKLPADTTKQSTISYWTLLKELDQKVDSKLPVHLFTDNSFIKFSGDRPAVSMNLNWHTYTSGDTTLTCIKKAYKISDDRIRLIISTSSPAGTYYSHQNISTANTSNKFYLKMIDGRLNVTLSDTVRTACHHPVEVDTSTIFIIIYSGKNTEDANYLRAAVNAVKDFTKYKIKVLVVNDLQRIPAHYNWLFWLSEETISTSFLRNNVFLYEKGKVSNQHAVIIPNNKVSSFATDDILLYKSIGAGVNNSIFYKTIWENGFSAPVLKVQKKNGLIYRFYSRFNPQWNDLVWSNQFPEIIYNLIFPEEENSLLADASDKRILDSTQIQPTIIASESFRQKQDLTAKKDLSKIGWIIAFVLFFLERILAHQLKKEEVYG